MASSTLCSLIQILFVHNADEHSGGQLNCYGTWRKCNILTDLDIFRALMCPWFISHLVPSTVHYDHHSFSHCLLCVVPSSIQSVGTFSVFSSKEKKIINQTTTHIAHDCHIVLNLLYVESFLQINYINLERRRKNKNKNTQHTKEAEYCKPKTFITCHFLA